MHKSIQCTCCELLVMRQRDTAIDTAISSPIQVQSARWHSGRVLWNASRWLSQSRKAGSQTRSHATCRTKWVWTPTRMIKYTAQLMDFLFLFPRCKIALFNFKRTWVPASMEYETKITTTLHSGMRWNFCPALHGRSCVHMHEAGYVAWESRHSKCPSRSLSLLLPSCCSIRIPNWSFEQVLILRASLIPSRHESIECHGHEHSCFHKYALLTSD